MAPLYLPYLPLFASLENDDDHLSNDDDHHQWLQHDDDDDDTDDPDDPEDDPDDDDHQWLQRGIESTCPHYALCPPNEPTVCTAQCTMCFILLH